MNLPQAALQWARETIGAALTSFNTWATGLGAQISYVTEDLRAFVGNLAGSVAEFERRTKETAVNLAAWAKMEIDALGAYIARVDAKARQIDETLAERSRQYQLERNKKAPLAPLIEWLLGADHAGGPASAPHPNHAAPWVALEELRREIQAFNTNAAHPVRATLDEFRGDLRAMYAGAPPELDVLPSRADALPGLAGLRGERGADPDARGLLTAGDIIQATQTTEGA